ncbi:MAG: HDIG domain-containing protein [Acidobacteria bacterium]|nr:HDIG domain-containing protein [Acidobacteriota bacterium]
MNQDKPSRVVPFRKRDDAPGGDARRWVARPAVAGVAACVLALVLLSPQLPTKIPGYEAGQVAAADITVPVDITVEDRGTTSQRRADARAEVLPVFDYSPAEFSKITKSLRDAFQWGRLQAPADTQHARDELYDHYQLDLSLGSVEFLGKSAYSPKIEAVLDEAIQQNYAQPIAPARSLAARGRSREIVIRNIQTQEEQRVLAKDVRSEEELQRAIEKSVQLSPHLTAWQKKSCVLLAGELLRPNTQLNGTETDYRERTAEREVEPVFYQLRRGRVILRKGDEVTDAKLLELAALREALSEQTGSAAGVLGLAVLLATLFFSTWFYLQAFYRGKKPPHETFTIICLIVTMSLVSYKTLHLLAKVIAGTTAVSFLQVSPHYYYAIPFALGALLLTLLLDGHVATIYTLLNCTIVGLLFEGDFYIVLYSLLGSLAAIYGCSHYKDRTAIYRTGVAISIISAFYSLILQFVVKTEPAPETYLFIVVMAFLSGLLVSILVSFLLPMFESMFNFITDIKLLELANLNLPILRQLMLEAPGTYHHSILIGSLAEAGAEAISLNPLFLRTAAYYHDIGKIRMAEYFIENQRGENPHDKLNPSMSALIIANHVKEGLETAARIKLPKPIADCIPQHHGTRLMSYFYTKAKERQDPRMDPVKEEDYRHQGPKPQTKEAAIMMLADAVEASARTLQDPSPGKLKNVIKKMLDTIVADGQFDECDINLRELDQVARAFLRVLIGVYHRRIDYPGFQFEVRKGKEGKA